MLFFKMESLRKLKKLTSKKDNDKDKPMKTLKSPPPQNPIYHKTNEIIPEKTVRIIEKNKIIKLLNSMLNNKLNTNP